MEAGMIPTKSEHIKLLEKILPQLNSDIQAWIKTGNSLIGEIFQRPVKTASGFSSGSESPKDTIIDWARSLEQIYGRNFEKLPFLNELKDHLGPFYSSKDTSPPRLSTGEDLTHELKCFLVDILSANTTTKAAYTLPSAIDLAEKTYAFLSRNTDDYMIDIPLLGLTIGQEIDFKYGKLKPIDLETCIDFLRDRSTGYNGGFRGTPNEWRILDAETLLKVKLAWSRADKSQPLMHPTSLQFISRNLVHLLRMYSFGGIVDCFQSIYVQGVGKRGRGVLYSNAEIARKVKYNVDSPADLTVVWW